MVVYDVIVVGGGLAGLTAATQLAESGLEVLVLEARDRVGGRTNTVSAEGYKWDVGGQWIGASQPKVRKLIDSLGLKLYDQYDEGKHILVLNGVRSVYEGNISNLNGLELGELEKAVEILDKKMMEVRMDNPAETPNAIEYDAMNMELWERQMFKSQKSIEVFNFLVRTVFASEPSQISFLFYLYFLRAAGGYNILANIHGGAQQNKVEGGTQQISDLLAKKLGKKRVILNSPVVEITQGEGQGQGKGQGKGHGQSSSSPVSLICKDGKKYKSRFVVIALPPSVAGNIFYNPPMPAMRDQLTQRMPCGCVIKMLILYDKAHWRAKGFSGEVLSTDAPVVLFYDATSPDGNHPAVVGFLAGNAAINWSGKEEQLKKATIEQLVGLFGEEMRNPKEFLLKDWSLETYSRGCYVGVMPSGMLTSVGKALREPVGRIHWAGTETASEWIGYMEGAVESGERVASELVERIKQEKSKL